MNWPTSIRSRNRRYSQVETRVLKELALPWGVAIYVADAVEDPLNLRRPWPKPATGPQGSGCGVVGPRASRRPYSHENDGTPSSCCRRAQDRAARRRYFGSRPSQAPDTRITSDPPDAAEVAEPLDGAVMAGLWRGGRIRILSVRWDRISSSSSACWLRKTADCSSGGVVWAHAHDDPVLRQLGSRKSALTPERPSDHRAR